MWGKRNESEINENNSSASAYANFCENLKLFLAFCVVNVLVLAAFAGIALTYCVLKLHPAINFVLLILALTLLSYVEALHYAVVAVEKWDMSQYADRFPRAVKCHKLVDTPEKVKKFLVGRQFFVIFVVFLIAQITSFPDIPNDFAGLPSAMVLILLQTGLPGIALVLTYGQLASQIFVEEFTLQLLNYYGCEFCIRLSLGAEYIGICHFSWFLFSTISRLFCGNVRRAAKILKSRSSEELLMLEEEQRRWIESQKGVEVQNSTADDIGMQPVPWAEPIPMTLAAMQQAEREAEAKKPKTTFDYVKVHWFNFFKYLWSTFATLGSVGIILYGIAMKAYILPVPIAGAYIIAGLMLTNLFFLEGLMIAIVGTQYWDPESFRFSHPRAYKIHKLVNKPDNVKRFIIGRQFCTVLTNFLLAQIFTFAEFPNPGWNPVIFYIIIKSGLVGVLAVLSFAQLMPELLAAEYPLRFMNLYYSYTVCWISLGFDFLGVGHCAWATFYVSRHFCCSSHSETRDKKAEVTKPETVQIESAEILAHEIEQANMPRRPSFSLSFGNNVEQTSIPRRPSFSLSYGNASSKPSLDAYISPPSYTGISSSDLETSRTNMETTDTQDNH